jgi:hypothetical protein
MKSFAACAVIALVSLVAPVTVHGQAGLAGQWRTDNVDAALAAQAAAPPAGEAAGRGRGGGGQAIIMDLRVDGSNVSGTVNEIGNGDPLTIESGSISGKTVTFVTQPRGVTWNIEMTDDDTITVLSRVFAARGGGGGRGPAAGGGGGPGAGRGGGPGGARGGGRGQPQPIVLHRVN